MDPPDTETEARGRDELTTPWGGLAPGPHAVGFRRTLATDYGRAYAREAGPRGRVYRPVLFAAWYPAAPSAGGDQGSAAVRGMTCGDYLRVDPGEAAPDADGLADGADWAGRMNAYLREKTFAYGLAGDPRDMRTMSAADEALLAEWERLPMRAARGAPPATGRFPLALY
ncbi:MAG TPA: hypothetical protein VM490_15390, partial [Armatimonadaceae bacterium]|nr:hypothetical protein [Armatimonadaceae bacterium]